MDNIIFYNIIKFIDNNNILLNYNINIFNANLDDLIYIINLNKLIDNESILKKNKKYFSKYVIREYNRIFLSTSYKILQSRLSIKNIIKYYKNIYLLKELNKDIQNKLFYNKKDKILQSRLTIKDIVKLSDYSFYPFMLQFYFKDYNIYIN